MKVLHVVPTYMPAWRYGGTIYSVHGLCKALSKNGVGVDVFDLDDPAVLDLNYRLYVAPLLLFPYTNVEDLRSNLVDLAESNPKLRELNLSELVDNSFVQRVEAEGVTTLR